MQYVFTKNDKQTSAYYIGFWQPLGRPKSDDNRKEMCSSLMWRTATKGVSGTLFGRVIEHPKAASLQWCGA